jgi:Flp pilus assembly protein TadG
MVFLSKGDCAMRILKSQKGSILVELVVISMLLVMFVLGTIEVFNIVRADIYLHKIVREGAREAALTGSTGAGEAMADDVAKQYFVSSNVVIPPIYHGYSAEGDTANVVCEASYFYKHFSFLNKKGVGVTELNAKAIYPWWDEVR